MRQASRAIGWTPLELTNLSGEPAVELVEKPEAVVGNPTKPPGTDDHAGKATNGYFYTKCDYVVVLTSSGWKDYAFGGSQSSFFSCMEGKSSCSYTDLVDAVCCGEATKFPRYQNAVNKKLKELGAEFHFRGSKRTNKVELYSGPWQQSAKQIKSNRKQNRKEKRNQ